MNQRLTCQISKQSLSYDIEIESGMLSNGGVVKHLIPYGSRFAIIADDVVSGLYGHILKAGLLEEGKEAFLFSFPSGEKNKTRLTKEQIEDQLFEQRLGRDTCIIALGGGVATDMAGYIAATFCRGVPLIMVPTSLLAMVDASIGGKTGVDVPFGKNLIGCIYQPKKVLIDPSLLQSLPRKEFKNGLVEMIKHGLIADPAYFEFLENHSSELLGLDIFVLEQAILGSCQIKQAIVEKDAEEQGERRLLNFGHTIGHALETLTNYKISHGEAVAIGIVVESYLAVELGYLERDAFYRIREIFDKYGSPVRLAIRLSPEAILKAMILDKKSLKGRPRFVILSGIGSCLAFGANFCTPIEEHTLINALEWMNHALCCH